MLWNPPLPFLLRCGYGNCGKPQPALTLFSSPAFSLYGEKCLLSIPKTYSCRDEQRAACQYSKEKQTAHRRFYPRKKPRNATQKKPSTTPFDVMLGFSWLQRFSADKAMRCLQIALSHFAAWRGNVLFRKISRAEAYRVHSIVLCFLIYFFAQE